MRRTKELFAFIRERHNIYTLKAAGAPKPWTTDPILQKYKFCNVYRELDTQTKWFAENWRVAHTDSSDLWFASLVFRFINWHETCGEIGYPVPFDIARRCKFIDVLEARKKARKKIYSGAYMISTHGVKESKSTYLANSLERIWHKTRYRAFSYQEGEKLADFHARLAGLFDVGSFLAGQVIADCRYAGKMRSAPDRNTFAAPGPGSRRGLARVCNLDTKHPWKDEEWLRDFRIVHHEIMLMAAEEGLPFIHGQDLQNCLCEYDKYERTRLGEGRPKSRYNGGVE